jgi:hypothetical protein
MGCAGCDGYRTNEETTVTPSMTVGGGVMVKTIIITYKCGTKLTVLKEGINNVSSWEYKCASGKASVK